MFYLFLISFYLIFLWVYGPICNFAASLLNLPLYFLSLLNLIGMVLLGVPLACVLARWSHRFWLNSQSRKVKILLPSAILGIGTVILIWFAYRIISIGKL